MSKTRKFIIKRFSYASDSYDDGINAEWIERDLNRREEELGQGRLGFGRWEVKEVGHAK